ncbi:tol-pal system-associated acyl-CoA thioesterase [Chitinasiproducens palmae]
MTAMKNSTGVRDGTLAFTWQVRVYYEDTDAGGVVFYANYLKFFERARTEWLRAAGIEQQRLVDERGIGFVVRRTEVEYLSPARLDDVLRIETRVAETRRCQVVFEQTAWRGEQRLARGSIQVVCIDMSAFRPMALPAEVAALFGADNGLS